MSRWTIYKKDGTVREITWAIEGGTSQSLSLSRAIRPDLKYTGEWMGKCEIMLNIVSAYPVNFEIGDYVMYRGEKFVINYDPGAIKQARRGSYGEGFKYDNVVFNSLANELTDIDFLDYVIAGNDLHYSSLPQFSFYAASIEDFCDRLQVNTDRYCSTNSVLFSNFGDKWIFLTPDRDRTIARAGSGAGSLWSQYFSLEAETSEEKKDISVTIDNQTIWSAMAMIKNDFGLNFIVRGRVVIVGAHGIPTSHVFKYGKGMGLSSIKQTADSDQQIITKLFSYGSGKNLPVRYYANIGLAPYLGINGDYSTGSTSDSLSVRLDDLDFNSGAFTNTLYDVGGVIWYGVKCKVGEVEFLANLECTSTNDGTVRLLAFSETAGTGVSFTVNRTTLANINAVKSAIDGGATKVFFVGGVDIDKFPASNRESVTPNNMPNNMAVNRLMLPGFPSTSLYDWVISNGGSSADGGSHDTSDVGKATWHGYTAFFSKDKSQPYILSQNYQFFGVREAVKNFDGSDGDEIYPTIENTGSDIISACEKIDDNGVFGDNSPSGFTITLPQFSGSFDLKDLAAQGTQDGGTPSIVMKSGYCGSREFKFESGDVKQNDNGTWSVKCQRDHDTLLDIWFPYSYGVSQGGTSSANERYQVCAGDKYILTGIPMSDSYISGAAEKLLEESLLFLSKNDYTRKTYEPDIDNIYMARDHEVRGDESLYMTIKEGSVMLFEDDDLGIDDGSMYIERLEIDEYGNGSIPKYKISLRNDKQVDLFTRLQDQIGGGSSGSLGGGYGLGGGSLANKAAIEAYGSELFLSKNKDDVAQGNITFKKNINVKGDSAVVGNSTTNGNFHVGGSSTIGGSSTVGDKSTVKGVSQFGETYIDGPEGVGGIGGKVLPNGDAWFQNLHVAGTMEAMELRFNRVSVFSGIEWHTPGGGKIASVEPDRTYTPVSEPDGNPSAQGWYESENYGEYYLSEDTEVDEEKTYYTAVTGNTGTIELVLEEGEIGEVDEGDICFGLFHSNIEDGVGGLIMGGRTYNPSTPTEGLDRCGNALDTSDNGLGNFTRAGFFSCYFTVVTITRRSNRSVFTYRLRTGTSNGEKWQHHPRSGMDFACYGSFTNPDRMCSRYITLEYERWMRNVHDWNLSPATFDSETGDLVSNGDLSCIAMQFGKLDNLQLFGLQMAGYSIYIDNAYLRGAIIQIPPEQIAEIAEEMATYQIELTDYVDVLTVDADGNVVGGLWSESFDLDNGTNLRSYRIHTAVSVYKNGNTPLVNVDLSDADGNGVSVDRGEYYFTATGIGCDVEVRNSTIYITGIDYVKDGNAQTIEQFDYDAMREVERVSVRIQLNCEGRQYPTKTFSVALRHIETSFITADMENEKSVVSWNTKSNQWLGLPVTFRMSLYHLNEILNIASVNNFAVIATLNGVALQTTTGGVTVSDVEVLSNASSPLSSGKKVGILKSLYPKVVGQDEQGNNITVNIAQVQVVKLSDSLSDGELRLTINATASYAGVSYEKVLDHVMHLTSDVNVYQLLLSDSDVHVEYVNGVPTASTNTLTCGITCDSTDDEHYTVNPNDYHSLDLLVTYQIAYRDGSVGNETEYTSSGVSVNSSIDKVTFRLYTNVGWEETNGQWTHLILSSPTVCLTDSEDVPVMLDGMDGAPAINLVIDNSNDSVLCTEDGQPIAGAEFPSTRCELQAGGVAIPLTDIGNHWSFQAVGCTAEWVQAEETTTKKVLRLTSITALLATVTINCTYDQNTQSEVMTIRKDIGTDRYNISFTTNSVSYSPNDNEIEPASVTCRVYKTTRSSQPTLMTASELGENVLDSSVSLFNNVTRNRYRISYSTDGGSSWAWRSLDGINLPVITTANLRSALTNGVNAVLVKLEEYIVSRSYDDNGTTVQLPYGDLSTPEGVVYGGDWSFRDQEKIEINVEGADGDGVEFVFLQWDVESPIPTIRDDSNSNTEVTIDGVTKKLKEFFQEPCYCPVTSDGAHQWTDEPAGVGLNHPYEFYAMRRKQGGEWKAFGDVHLWNLYPTSAANTYTFDLTNDECSVKCDSSGNIVQVFDGNGNDITYETTEIILLHYSNDDRTNWLIKCTPVNVSCNGYYPRGGTAVSGQTECPSGGFTLYDPEHPSQNPSFVLHVDHLTAVAGQVNIEATNGSLTLTLVYKVSKSYAGEDAQICSLRPQASVVHRMITGTGYVGTNLDFDVKKIVGSALSMLSTWKDFSDNNLAVFMVDERTSPATMSQITKPSSAENTDQYRVSLSSAFDSLSSRLFLLKEYVNNSWSKVHDRERLYVVTDGQAGQSSFKSTVFKRSNDDLSSSAPSATSSTVDGVTYNTYNQPTPPPSSGWTDGIPDGEQQLWCSTRIFTSDGESPQQSSWTIPRKMTDTEVYDVEFAMMQANDAIPDDPSDENRHGGSGPQIWFDPELDKRVSGSTLRDFTVMYWRAERVKRNGVWSSWVKVRIKGEQGDPGESTDIRSNLLDGTGFVRNYPSAWYTHNGTIVNNGVNGQKAIYYNNTSSYSTDILKQIIYEQGLISRVKPGTLYTLSYWVKGSGSHSSFISPSIIDTTVSQLVDGATSQTNADGQVTTQLSGSWVRRTITFKTKSTFPANTVQYVLFQAGSGSSVYLSCLKLEEGEKATDWCLSESDKVGDPGNGGMDWMHSYYKAFAESSGVDSSVLSIDASTQAVAGWSKDTLVYPTAELPYVWKFTAVKITGSTSATIYPAELIMTYQSGVNPNILKGATLNGTESLTLWNKVSEFVIAGNYGIVSLASTLLYGKENTSGTITWENSLGTKPSLSVGEKLLLRRVVSSVNKVPSWATGIGTDDYGVTEQGVDGQPAFHDAVKGVSSNYTSGKIILSQIVHKKNTDNRLLNSQWYTLSFWMKKSLNGTLKVSVGNTVYTSAGIYVDNQYYGSSNSNDKVNVGTTSYKEFSGEQDWSFHTITFKTISTLTSSSSNTTVTFEIESLSSEIQADVWICMPKLERGMMFTGWQENAASLSLGELGTMYYPVGEITAGTFYYHEKTSGGKLLIPYGSYNGQYYYLLSDSNSGYAPTGSTNDTRWGLMNVLMRPILTNGIIADYGKLASAVFCGDFMFSQHGRVRTANDWQTIDGTTPNYTYNGSTKPGYTYFDASDPVAATTHHFQPAWCVNLLTGDMVAARGNFVVRPNGDVVMNNATIRGSLLYGKVISMTSIQGNGMTFWNRDTNGNIILDANVVILNMQESKDTSATLTFPRAEDAIGFSIKIVNASLVNTTMYVEKSDYSGESQSSNFDCFWWPKKNTTVLNPGHQATINLSELEYIELTASQTYNLQGVDTYEWVVTNYRLNQLSS